MIVDLASSSGQRIRTTICSLCGDRFGEDFNQFSSHLESEHTFTDLGLDSDLEPTDTRQALLCDGGRPDLEFVDEYIAPIIDGAKTATIRLDGPDLHFKSTVTAVGEDGSRFATLELRATASVAAVDALDVLDMFHAKYPASTADQVLDGLRRHYDEDIGPATPVDVYVFECVEHDGIPERCLRADGGEKGCLSSHGMDRTASQEELAEFAARISGKLDLDAVADEVGHAVINASPACLRDNKQRLEAEDFNTELYVDGRVYDEPTLLVHPRPGDLDGDRHD